MRGSRRRGRLPPWATRYGGGSRDRRSPPLRRSLAPDHRSTHCAAPDTPPGKVWISTTERRSNGRAPRRKGSDFFRDLAEFGVLRRGVSGVRPSDEMSAFALVRILWGGTMFLAGIWVIAAPRAFYAHTPGLNIESVYDTHLLRDIGLIFLAFGVGLLAAFRSAPAAIAIAWPPFADKSGRSLPERWRCVAPAR